MTQPFFIAATGTGMGKTWFTCKLTRQLIAGEKSVQAVKPVISGFDMQQSDSDTHLLLSAMGQAVNDASIESVSPWRFVDAISPDMAGRKENRPIDFEALVDWCKSQAQKKSDYLLIEGVGGAMTPLTDHHTALDWMAALRYPVILLGGTYLGTLSHTLTAIEALRRKNIAIHALVLNPGQESADVQELAPSLRNFIGESIPIHVMPDQANNLLPIIS